MVLVANNHLDSVDQIWPLKEVDLAYSNEATSHWLKQLKGIAWPAVC